MMPAMERNIFAFVMAGGSGERFWPMSRRSTPKHLLRLLDDKTLLETTVRRLEGVVAPENIRILTNAAQIEATRQAVPFLAPCNIIAEPAKRDTAPACALATAVARAVDPDSVCVVLPADAMIHDVATFRRQIAEAAKAADETGAIATLGIPPTFAATGYGYLETGEPLSGNEGVRRLKRFVEKPDEATAQRYVGSGNFLWNAGIFVWKTSTFLDEARRQLPALATFIESIPSLDALPAALESSFASLPKISVDYAIMENAASVVTLPASFDWDDVGAWTALPAHIAPDVDGNCRKGEVVQHGSRDNIAVSNGRLVALCGVSGLVVVETSDAVLVCSREAVQEVKALQPLIPEPLK
jgi:mannose-1-phosphate guanylyltransferase